MNLTHLLIGASLAISAAQALSMGRGVAFWLAVGLLSVVTAWGCWRWLQRRGHVGGVAALASARASAPVRKTESRSVNAERLTAAVAADVLGQDAAVAALAEAVAQGLGAAGRRGTALTALLSGSRGVGKRLSATSLARHLSRPLVSAADVSAAAGVLSADDRVVLVADLDAMSDAQRVALAAALRTGVVGGDAISNAVVVLVTSSPLDDGSRNRAAALSAAGLSNFADTVDVAIPFAPLSMRTRGLIAARAFAAEAEAHGLSIPMRGVAADAAAYVASRSGDGSAADRTARLSVGRLMLDAARAGAASVRVVLRDGRIAVDPVG